MRVANGAALLLLGIGSVVGAGTRAPTAAQESGSDRPASVRVPLVAGLIIVSALHEPGKGDQESILKVDDVFAGLTCYTLSGDVLSDLKARGQTSLAASIADDDLRKVLGAASRSARAETTLERVEPEPVPISMIVNDRRVELLAVHARGTLGSQPFDIYMLDDAVMPIVLRWQLGDTSKRMIRISYPLEHPSSRIADSLVATGRAEVYGIYFDFSSATIRPESEAVLKEIADVMTKNPKWKLNIEGRARNRRVELVRQGDGQWG